jgi:hypothetical protein
MEFVIRVFIEVYTSIYDYSELYDLLDNMMTSILLLDSALCAIFLALVILGRICDILFKKQR